MGWWWSLILVVQVLSAIGVIVLVLLQHGKGADMGAAFGSGASGSLFGASGSANFLSRSTGALATVFLASTLALALFANQRPAATTPSSVMDQVPVPARPADTIPGGGAGAAAPSAPASPAVEGSGAGAPAAKPEAPSQIPK